MILHLGSIGDVAFGITEVMESRLDRGGIGKREVAMATHHREAIDEGYLQPLELLRTAFQKAVQASL
jgi:hypothetical protein